MLSIAYLYRKKCKNTAVEAASWGMGGGGGICMVKWLTGPRPVCFPSAKNLSG